VELLKDARREAERLAQEIHELKMHRYEPDDPADQPNVRGPHGEAAED
jgi:hypothetical protein